MAAHYKNHLVEVTDTALRIRHYYFPFGDKIIPFSEIEEIVQRPASLLTGKWRVWGTATPDVWFALDWARPKRDVMFLAILKNKKIKAGFSVEHPQEFAAIVSQKVPFRQSR